MTPLTLALHYWRWGVTLPLDLAVELMALGYDVDALETKYLTGSFTS